MKEVKLALTINELNLILEALGNQPYIRVYELIDKLQDQARAQLNGSASNLDLQKTAQPTGLKTGAHDTGGI